MEITGQVLDEVVEAIVKEVRPEQIILFGSVAVGKETPKSDMDLLVVESFPFGKHKSRRKEIALILRALMRFDLPIDILLYSREEVEHWRNSLNNIIGRVFREGRVLYERRP